MNALQELILREVAWRYPHDTSFYHQRGFNSGRWGDFKSGKTDLDNMKYGRVKGMTKGLITDFELSLLNQAQFNVSLKWTKLSVLEEYDRLRLETVKSLGENLVASILPTVHGESMSNNVLKVEHETFPYIKMFFKNINPPAGKKNRREYILSNLDKLV